MADPTNLLLNIVAQGGPAAAGQLAQVTAGIQNAGSAAAKATGGVETFGTSLLGTVGKLVTLGAGLVAVRGAFEELGEADRAAVTLRKFGVSAGEAAAQAQLLQNLGLFKNGDDAAAAELYGKVMAGNTRELHLYGIELAENATRQDRLNALQEIAARGVLSWTEKNNTLTGSLGVLWEGLAGKGAGALSKMGQKLNDQIAAFNVWAGFSPTIREQEDAWNEVERATARAALRHEEDTAKVKTLTAATQALITQIDISAKAQDREAAATRNASAAAKAREEAIIAETKAQIDLQVARGQITEQEGNRQKGKLDSDQSVANAQRNVDDSANQVGSLTGRKGTTEEQQRATDAALEDAKKKRKGIADEAAGKQADDEISALQKKSDELKAKAEQLDKDLAEASAKLEIARAELAKAQAEKASSDIKGAAQSNAETTGAIKGVAGGVTDAARGVAGAAKGPINEAQREAERAKKDENARIDKQYQDAQRAAEEGRTAPDGRRKIGQAPGRNSANDSPLDSYKAGNAEAAARKAATALQSLDKGLATSLDALTTAAQNALAAAAKATAAANMLNRTSQTPSS